MRSRESRIKGKKYKFKEFNEITLITLVITIVILIILAGVAINIALGKNGIINRAKSAKEKYEITQLKEEIELEIQKIEQKEVKLGNEITLESVLQELLDNKTFETIDKEDKIGYIEIYEVKLKYNEEIGEENKVIVDYIKEEEGVRITYSLEPSTYTKQEKVDILLKVQGKVKSITKPDGLVIYPKQDIVGIDYYVTANGTYSFIIENENGKKEEKNVIVDIIDRLPPKSFEIEAEATIYGGLKITANAEDGEADETNAKSGIGKYEYYIKLESENEYTKYDVNEIKNLPSGTYKIYAVAYDKAENRIQSSNEVEVIVGDWVQIWTEEDLRNIKNDLTKNYIIMQDIELTQEWTPLGVQYNNAFSGILEGNNKKIIGLSITTNNSYQGLFGYINNGAVKNLNIFDCNINGKQDIGAIAGFATNATIQKVQASGTIKASSGWIGGIVGNLESSSISETVSSITIEAATEGSYIGGIAGKSKGSSINKSKSTGNVKGMGTIGGLIGELAGGTVSNSYSLGNVVGTYNDGRNYGVGGLVGTCYSGTISYSYTKSKIISNGGGFLGDGGENIASKCYWCPTLAGVNSSASGTSLTLEKMKNQESYEGWDFESGTVWRMEEFPELIFDFDIEE